MILRKMKNTKKKSILIVSLSLILLLTVGGTFAFLSSNAGPVNNIFAPSKVTTAVDETFKDGEKTNVSIKNTGDTTAYIRAAVVLTWQDESGENVYPAAPIANLEYEIEYDLSNGWVLGSDGYYYWTKPVEAKTDTNQTEDCQTGVLIKSCKTIEGKAPTGYALCVEIIGSGIQAVPTSVVTENWSSGVSGIDEDGTTLLIKTTSTN